MVKRDLVNKLVEAFPGITKRDMGGVIDALFDCMSEALIRGEAVEVRGVGRFKVKERAPRQGRNPKTNASVQVPRRWTIHFKPSQDLITVHTQDTDDHPESAPDPVSA